jgi:hypothetical protein
VHANQALWSFPICLAPPVLHVLSSPDRHLISIFNDHELELLISGLPDIDVADLRANTEYTGYSAASQVIR